MEPNDSHIREQTSMNYTLKNIPEEIYDKIKLRAQSRRRSINREIIAILSEVVNPRRVSVEDFLSRADEIRARTKGFVTDDFLRKAKRDGLP